MVLDVFYMSRAPARPEASQRIAWLQFFAVSFGISASGLRGAHNASPSASTPGAFHAG